MKHPFILHLAQQGLNVNLIQIASSGCVLPAGVLPDMFPVTRKNAGYPHEWKEGSSPGAPSPYTSWITATQELTVPPCQSQGIVSKPVSQKWDHTFFWTHLHFPGCSFLHLPFQQKSHCLLSCLHRILSIFSQSNAGFYFLFFPSIQSPHHSPPTAILCICKKSVNFRNYLYFMGIHTLCQNDGPKVWRVISTPEFVS